MMGDKIYVGTVASGNMDWHVHVAINGSTQRLNPRYDLANHSPDGFAWGYSGSGPAQLSLAIMADYLRGQQLDFSLAQKIGRVTDEDLELYAPRYDRADYLALRVYQDFKRAYIALIDKDSGFTLSETLVHSILVKLAEKVGE